MIFSDISEWVIIFIILVVIITLAISVVRMAVIPLPPFAIVTRDGQSMQGAEEPPEITFADIQRNEPDFIYVHGMVASGKSTLSDKLSKLGYTPIHIDELVREEFPTWPKEIYLDSPNGELTEDQEKLFSRLKKEMGDKKKIIVDGFIAPLVWKKLYQYRPWDLLIFIKHRNAESYRIAIMKRAIYDMDHNLRTLSSFWRLPEAADMIIEYKEKGADSEKLRKMVDTISVHKWEKLEKDQKYWTDIFDKNGWRYSIYYTDLTKKEAGNFLPKLYVQSPWYEEIVSGKKTIEGRSGPYQKFKEWIGGELALENKNSKIIVKVIDVKHYDTLEEYIDKSNWKNIAPHMDSREETIQAYRDIIDRDGHHVFSDENIKSHGGMNAIYLQL